MSLQSLKDAAALPLRRPADSVFRRLRRFGRIPVSAREPSSAGGRARKAKYVKSIINMIDILKNPELDPDGMATYEYLVNNVETCHEDMPTIVENLKRCDMTGQFTASSARFLAAVDREHYADWLPHLIEATIDKDRERRYIWSLLEAIWGEDYEQRLAELQAKDDHFRRIYKRVYPKEGI